MDVQQAFEYLQKEGLVTNIQTVRRWIREGKLKASMEGSNRKQGYSIEKKDLIEFIQSKKPDVSADEIELAGLKEEMERVYKAASKWYVQAMIAINGKEKLEKAKDDKSLNLYMSHTVEEAFKLMDKRSYEELKKLVDSVSSPNNIPPMTEEEWQALEQDIKTETGAEQHGEQGAN